MMRLRFAVLGALVTFGLSSSAHGQPAAPEQPEPLPTEVSPEQHVPELDDPLPKAFAVRAGGLTAAQVAQRAVATSPDLRARQAELEAAAARVDAAMIGFLPKVTLSASYTRLSPVDNSLSSSGGIVGAANTGVLGVGPCPTGGGNCVLDSAGTPVAAAPFVIESVLDNYSLKAALSVPISDYVLRLSHSIEAAESNRNAAALNRRAEQLKVASDAQVAFYNWTRGIGQLAVAEKSLERTKARLSDTRMAFRLGTATQADVLRLEALVASTEAAIEEARAFRQLAAEQLSLMMRDKRRTFTLGENVLDRQPAGVGAASLNGLISEAQSKRLELRALAQTQHSLRESAKVVRRGQLPRVDGFAEYNYANPNPRAFPARREWSGSWQAGLTATWVINETFASGATARELEANVRQVEAQRQSLRDGIRMEVTRAYLDFRKARAALAAAVRGAKASREAYSVARSLYRFGKATTTELIEAEGELVSAQLARINAQIDLLVAQVKLRHAVGRDVS